MNHYSTIIDKVIYIRNILNYTFEKKNYRELVRLPVVPYVTSPVKVHQKCFRIFVKM